MDKVNKLNRFVKKNNDFIRMYTAGVKSIDLDSTGRLLVPKDLIAISKLTKNVVLSSSINIIEIWDKDEYEKSINNPKVDFDDNYFLTNSQIFQFHPVRNPT